MRNKLLFLVCVAVVICSAAWLCRLATRRSDVSFLPLHHPSEWIVYPRPPLAHLQAVAEMPCVFRRTFHLDQAPGSAQISIRACRRCVVEINGARVQIFEETNNWKRAQEADVGRFLRSGENSILVTAFNHLGPPALWLNLEAGKLALNSDNAWESSFAGAVWRPARLADQPPPAAEGNPLRGGEKTLTALRDSWRSLSVIALLATAIVLVAFKVQGSSSFANATEDKKFILLRQSYGGQEVQGSESHSPTHPLSHSPFLRSLIANPAASLLVAIAVLWTVLVVHNLGFVPRNAGFDAFGHMEYIQHIQAKGTLPAGNEGWEMHQPPLYYSVAAALLNAMHLTPDTSKGLAVLRLFSLAVGLVHILFIFGSMRLLFPSQISLQVVGLLFGSFLPMQLYLVHYVTNETFAACLISGTIYLVLKLLQEQKQWSADASLARRSLGEGGSAHSWFLYIAVGVCLGLALLSKITALVVAPFVLSAMWWPLVRYLTECARPGRSNDLKPAADRSASHALEQSELAAPETGALRLGQRRSAFSMRVLQPLLGTLACIAVCAWYFRDVWKEFGNPFFAPTRWAYAVGWWQDPGYRTAAYFTHFGRSLIDPLLSGVASFADGIYSTLWGDGYCGGLAEQIYRPPWNYNLMVASYLLALIPTALLMAGIARSIRRMIREPELSWVLLIGFSFAMVLGIVHLNLMVPIYAQAKAFFGHSALTALCAFMAMGWRCVENRGRTVRMVAAVLLGIWAVTSYASFWVSADSAAAQASIARDLMNEGKPAKALPHLIAAIEQDPRNIAARSFLVSLLRDSGQITNALEVAQQGIQIQPDQALSHMDLAGVLDRQDHKPEAVNEIRRATELAPDSPEARLQLASHLMELRRYGEAITASREALRVLPTDPEVHNILAYSLLNEARTSGASSASANEDCLNLNPLSQTNAPLSTADILTAAAIAHFRLVVKLAPRSADPFNTLAWILSTYPRAELRNASEALELARAACAITKDTNAEMLATLAAAHAENGQFEQAVQAADRAAKLPITNAGLRERIEKMMKLFGANHPYRQESKK